MRTIAAITLCAFSLIGHAQDREAILSIGRAYVDTLTSEYFHGRGYVNKGDSLAAAYIASEFKHIGLAPLKADHFQPFSFKVNTFPDSMRVTLDGRTLIPGIDYIVDPTSGSASGTFEVVHLDAQALLDPARRSLAMGVATGRAIHVQWPETKNADSLQLFQMLRQDLMHYGPVLERTEGKLTWSVGREALPYPLIQTTSEHLTDSTARAEIVIRNEIIGKHQARNVLGVVKGKSKRYVVVSAHYDHLGRMGSDTYFPGANDNASGVAMMLALAQHFKKHPPKHNILFVAFAGEEAGLLGSEWCVVDRPMDWSTVDLMINLDILGTGDDGITVVNATAQQEVYDRLVSINKEKGYLPEVRSRGPACNSDHCPFVKRKVPAIFIYTLGGIAAYHDVHDRGETLPLTKFPELFQLLRDHIASMR